MKLPELRHGEGRLAIGCALVLSSLLWWLLGEENIALMAGGAGSVLILLWALS